jgi:hypothetical protein
MLTIERSEAAAPQSLQRELAQLRAENKYLREKLPMSNRYSKTLAIAQADAVELIDSRWYSERTSKLFAVSQLGMSENRWYWAVALLRFAGIVELGSGRSELQFVIVLHTDVITALNRACTTLNAAEDGYGQLRRRLPRSRRTAKKRGKG